jgi:copper chaperone
MERITMKIEGMSCGHCVASVNKALAALGGVNVERVTVGQAIVNHDPAIASADVIARAIEDEGYAVVSTDGAQARPITDCHAPGTA